MVWYNSLNFLASQDSVESERPLKVCAEVGISASTSIHMDWVSRQAGRKCVRNIHQYPVLSAEPGAQVEDNFLIPFPSMEFHLGSTFSLAALKMWCLFMFESLCSLARAPWPKIQPSQRKLHKHLGTFPVEWRCIVQPRFPQKHEQGMAIQFAFCLI